MSDIDLFLDEARENERDGTGVYAYASPALDGLDNWWSAQMVVRLPPGLSFLEALTRHQKVAVTIVYDIDPLDSGLDEHHWRSDAEWSTRKPETIDIPVSALCREVSPYSTNDLVLRRDEYRIANNLPRHVIRSDVRDKNGRRPLHALRHPWPAGIFIQGGSASRVIELSGDPESTARIPAGAQIVDRRDGTRCAVIRDRVFIEAFPPSSADNPSGGFLRGEGETFAEAEDGLWARWEAQRGCPSLASTGKHRWEQRGYRNGAGFCADCNIFGSGVFDLADIGSVCIVCGVGTYWTQLTTYDAAGKKTGFHLVCKDHAPPGYSDIDAHFRRDPDDPPEQPLTAEQESAVLARLPDGTRWGDLDFDARHRAAHLARRDMLAQSAGR